MSIMSTPKLFVNHEQYDHLMTKLALKIHENRFEFNNIVCIARGGMPVGDMLSRVFDKPLSVIFANSYTGEHQGDLKISTSIAGATDTLGKRILLVDDLADSGKTLVAVKNHLQTLYPESEIKTAVLWVKDCSVVTPDFYTDKVSSDVWITQPFESFDDFALPLQITQ